MGSNQIYGKWYLYVLGNGMSFPLWIVFKSGNRVSRKKRQKKCVLYVEWETAK